jgi:hypothetical protein
MRCREALNRLNRLERSGQHPDRELLEHLESCPACARQAEAARELGRAFAEMSTRDETDQITWSEQVHRVEAVARAHRNQPKEMPIMSALKRQLKLRPRLSVSLATTMAVLLAATLIPFKFDQTVGFEVAVAGVNRDLALNQDKLNEMLERLGLSNVHITVTGCEATCNLVLSDLDSEQDASLLRLAFEEIGGENVVVQLKMLDGEVSQSALGHTVNRIWINSRLEKVDEYELQHIVIERLGSDFNAENTIFFTSENGDTVTMSDPAIGAGFRWYTTEDNAEAGTLGNGAFFIGEADVTDHGDDESHESVHNLPKLESRHWLNDTLTDAARAELAAQGWKVDVSEDRTTFNYSRIGDAGELVEATQEVGKETALPEGYSLSQSYPNPFNPTTQIDFSIPQTERVTIEVFNINGQKVRTLLDEVTPAGTHTVTWNATSDSGGRVASGVYLYRLTAGEKSTTKKMTLIK